MKAERLEKLNELSTQCPRGHYVADCPFKVLKSVPYCSRKALFSAMEDDQFDALMQLALNCHCQSDGKEDVPACCHPVGAGS
ncbi:MAG TPA: hypothetical protein PKE26_10535 [Kiritimatiellia bacterium]|nr:hypothetical protein [Kiritimatiellia bacterium]HMO99534.1 hypothetical protein [Kiritimatiellia bacterium]HMP97153.1 hypothetical protein [Kiritimatiellia bacterium]